MIRAKYRHSLPQLNGRTLLTDGGLETTLIFHEGVDIPYFASFDLLRTREGRSRIKQYYERYLDIALTRKVGFVLDTPTWRASRDWGDKLGYSPTALATINREAVELMFELRDAHETPDTPLVVSGNVGPRGDGYNPAFMMSADEAEAYHAVQVGVFAEAGVDMITVMTMNYVAEATGIARAAASAGLPCAMSFTVETDGRLPTGQPLGEAIEEVDRETRSAPAYFMINCAHPDHFRAVIDGSAAWTKRVGGLRANASRQSHAELDASETLDAGNPAELGQDYAVLARLLPNMRVLGGCCGTDHRHVTAIADAVCR